MIKYEDIILYCIFSRMDIFIAHSDIITHHKDTGTEDAIDPNALYPELPPNHPKIARVLSLPPYSNCPVENGIVKTKYVDFSLIFAFLRYIHVPLFRQMIVLYDL